MSYDTVEAGLLSTIRLLSVYSSTNSSQGDYTVLGSGITRAVILTPGPFERSVQAIPRRMSTVWTANIELYVPFTVDISSIASAIRTERQTLIDHLDKYPTLNSTSGVVHAIVIGGQEPTQWVGESQQFWVQELLIRITENVTIAIAE